jgi:hypothetical protein
VVAAWARVAESNYQYPVDSQVLSSDGRLLDHRAANAILEDSVPQYRALLDAAH